MIEASREQVPQRFSKQASCLIKLCAGVNNQNCAAGNCFASLTSKFLSLLGMWENQQQVTGCSLRSIIVKYVKGSRQ